MSDDSVHELPAIPPGGSAVVLPCTADQFSSFIGDLLGKPQVITRAFFGPIDIKYDDLVSLFHLIDHRLKEQNKATLLQFGVTFSYDDNSSVVINSFEEFSHYAEVKNVETLVVGCSFEYLVLFQGRSHPERQVIDVTFSRSDRRIGVLDDDTLFQVMRTRMAGNVSFRIKHTARSWGADLEALLSSHVKGLIRKETGVRSWLRSKSGWIGALFAFVACVGGLFTLISVARYLNADRFSDAERVLSNIHDNASAVRLGIPLLVKENMTSWSPWFAVSLVGVLVVTGILAIFVAGFVTDQLGREYPSFLTFTKADAQRKPLLISTYAKSGWYSLGTAVGAVLYGMIGNYAFELLRTWFR